MQSTQLQQQQMDPLTIALRSRRGKSVSHWHVSPFNSAVPSQVRQEGGQDAYDFLRKLGNAWDSRDRSSLQSGTTDRYWDQFFDPELSEKAFRQFIAYGGLDLLIRMLMDNPHWMYDAKTDGSRARGAFSLFRDPLGVHAIWLLALKVLTEAIIVDNDIGWIIFRQHRGLPLRLLQLLKCNLFYESATTLLEHLVSVVGPVLLVEEIEHARSEFKEGSDVNLAALFRPLALLCTPSAVSDSARRVEMEPFPQCLSRMRKGEDNALRNVTAILTNGPLLARLMKLIEYKSQGIRIFAGNRTMTVVPPTPGETSPEQQQQMSMQQLQAALMQLSQGGGGEENQEALMAALQQAFGGQQQQQQQQQNTGGGSSSGGGPAAGEPTEEQSLQEMADSLQSNIPKQNQLDSANYGWCTGRPDGRIFWRLENPTLDCKKETPLFSEERAKLESTYFENVKGIKIRQDHQQKELDEQAIVNSQSEITYVLATFMMATCRETAWEQLMRLGTLERLTNVFDHLFHPTADKSFSMQADTGDTDPFAGAFKRPEMVVMGEGPGAGESGFGDEEDSDDEGSGKKGTADSSTSAAAGASGGAAGSSSEQNRDQKKSGKKRGRAQGGNVKKSHGSLPDGNESDASSTLECEGIEKDDAAKDDDDLQHQHNSDILRKIEILRLSYELWTVSEPLELKRKLAYDRVQEQSYNLARKIIHLLKEPMSEEERKRNGGHDLDPCLEAQGYHAIEGFIRGFGREARPKMQNTVAELILPFICENLLTAFSPESKEKGKKNPLRPKKRLQAVLSCVGELIRHNPTTTEMLESLVGQACHAGSVLGEEERKRTAFGEMILHYPQYSHFLLRGLMLTMYPDWRSHENYCCVTREPQILAPDRTTVVVSRVFNVKVLAHRMLERVVRDGPNAVSLADICNAMLHANVTPRGVEQQQQQQEGRGGEDALSASEQQQQQDFSTSGGGGDYRSDKDFMNRLYLPFADLEGTDAYARLHSEQERDTLKMVNVTPEVESHLMIPPLSAASLNAPKLSSFFQEHRAQISFRIILECDIAGAENTEMLAMITTTMMMFKTAQDDEERRAAEEGTEVRELAMMDEVYEWEEKKWRPQKLRDIGTSDDVQRRKVARYDSGRCFFKGICLWMAHYCCAQKYIVTYHYCTDVSFDTISKFALYILGNLKKRIYNRAREESGEEGSPPPRRE